MNVTKTKEFRGSFYGFSLASFTAIHNQSIPDDSNVDVIGHISKCIDLHRFPVPESREKSILKAELQDHDGLTVSLTLWDQYAQKLYQFVKSNDQDNLPIIIMLQFARLKRFRGAPYVSNGYSETRLFINDDQVEDINIYKSSLYAKTRDESSSSWSTIVAAISYSVDEELTVNHQFKFMSEVKEINEAESVVVLGTIKMLCQDAPWFYMGCNKCARKMRVQYSTTSNNDGTNEIEHSRTYECNNVKCKDVHTSPIPRFRIQVRVQDTTDSIALTLFDRDCCKLLNIFAQELIDKNVELADEYTYLAELNVLLQKKCVFKIDINDYNINRNIYVFGVSRVSDDENIISILEAKYKNEPGMESNSHNTMVSPMTTTKTLSC